MAMRPRAMWDDHNITHIARHHVTVAEVEQVIAAPGTVFQTSDTHRVGRIEAWGVVPGTRPRHLLVILDRPTTAGDAYVVTARPMTTKERRSYERDR
jgi:uncharacterized DUF497 family protein